MKRYIIILMVIATVGMSSCENYLDAVAEVEGATEAVVFNDFNSVRGYFDQIFEMVDDYMHRQSQGMANHYLCGEMSDELANVRKPMANMGTRLNRGIWDTDDGMAETGWNDNNWHQFNGNVIPKSFHGIRICNRILEEVPGLTRLTDDQKTELIAQAHFFRAWFNFEVIRRVGGFVKLDRSYFSHESGNMERMTYAESTDWLIEDLDEAIKLLPTYWSTKETGRPTKSSAYALRSMAQLYSASPLMQNPIDRTDVITEYNKERAEKAAEYAKDCLDFLDRNKSVYDQTLMDGSTKDEYTSIFWYQRLNQYSSRECLFYVAANFTNNNRHTVIYSYFQNWRMSDRRGNQGTPNVNPTLNMLNKFETKNGYTCELTGNNVWVCDDPDWDRNFPHKDRDPRFEQFILFPGESFGVIQKNDISTAAPQDLVGKTVPDLLSFYLCTWDGGLDTETEAPSVEGGRGDVVGRYLIRKWHWPACVRGNNTNANYNDNTFATMIIRTTQVWLDYAEALNEAYGPDVTPPGHNYSAIRALNMIRNRVGMPNVEDTHDVSTKEKLRERIRNERAVELLCENHRWFDIRRWMIAEDLFRGATPIYRASLSIKTDWLDKCIESGPVKRFFPPGETKEEREEAKWGGCFTFYRDPITEEQRVFERKHYWYPMRRDEVFRYPTFKQNPGW